MTWEGGRRGHGEEAIARRAWEALRQREEGASGGSVEEAAGC